jgi:penicillin-binding protein 1A
MRLLLKIAAFLAGSILLCLLAVFCWFYFYSRDLPDISRLAQFTPSTATEVNDSCLGESTAISYREIGTRLRNAINATEVNEDDPGVLQQFVGRDTRQRGTAGASWIISRTMFCEPSRLLNRQLAELRTAIQLERHYSRRELFTIFANRVYLGPELIGIQNGSKFYFNKNAADLTVPEAALLVAVMSGPTACSPIRHPDRALRRRNEVIDAMLGNGVIAVAEAQVAKSAPLGVIAPEATKSPH